MQSRVHAMPFGASIQSVNQSDKTVLFQLWAPTAKAVDLVFGKEGEDLTKEKRRLSMSAEPGGRFSLSTPEVAPGQIYKYLIDGESLVPDPASRYQVADVHGPSKVIDPTTFKWSDGAWQGRPWSETILYEIHVGTFTKEGTFRGVINKLDSLLALGITAIELMPIADFPGGRNWGYDGVLPYAPDNSYGTPDDLKELIDTAHQKGLMVFLDVVYNHFGPEGNYLHVFAKSFFTDKYQTPWGAAIDFENSQEVRSFFIHNTLYWLEEYHLDGLRFDAVHAITDNSPHHFLNELAETVRNGPGKARHIHLVLENEHNTADLLSRESDGKPVDFTAQWNDDIHHALHVLATGENEGYYQDFNSKTSHRSPIEHLGRGLAEGFIYQGEISKNGGKKRGQPSSHLPSRAFVPFIQNHDQVGNRAFGERLSVLTDPDKLKAIAATYLLAPQIPMLFMGEEWASTTPFCYFCELGPELGPLVTAGRRKEFEKFAAFRDPHKRDTIPDPCDPKTFESSKLNWHEIDESNHKQFLEFYTRVLAARKQFIMPLLESINPGGTYKIQGNVLRVDWQAKDGNLILIGNFGDERQSKIDFVTPDDLKNQIVFALGADALADLKANELGGWNLVWLIK
jgi:malto-oligosyltrehalose trehalohydrolase